MLNAEALILSLLQVKRANPEKNCFLEYDRLYIDHKIYVYNDVMGQESVLRHYFDLRPNFLRQTLFHVVPAGGGNVRGTKIQRHVQSARNADADVPASRRRRRRWEGLGNDGRHHGPEVARPQQAAVRDELESVMPFIVS